MPFEETDMVDHPVFLYAATKKSNELMAHSLYKIPATGFRFFTVYGPKSRPDMAYFGFTDKYFASEPIKIFNNGNFENDLYRDFICADNIVEGIERLLSSPSVGEGGVSHQVFNNVNNNPEKLMVFIETLKKCLSNSLGQEVQFEKVFEPIKPGGMCRKPKTTIEDELQQFAD